MRHLTLLGILGFVAVSAQPIIQYDDLQLLGNTYDIAVVTDPGTSDPMPNGEDITWDFSSATTVIGGAAAFISPAGTPYAASFPTANLCLRVTVDGEDRYAYYILDPYGLAMLGEDMGTPDAATYSEPKNVLQFPFTYGTSYVDDYTQDGTEYSISRSCTGHGTVILPTGEVSGVLKMISTSGSIDFFASDPAGPLVGIDADGVVAWVQNSVGVEERPNAAMVRAWPNPSRDRVRIDGVSGMGTWRLLDTQGRVVLSGSTNGADHVLIELGGLAHGQYVVQVGDARYWTAAPIVRE